MGKGILSKMLIAFYIWMFFSAMLLLFGCRDSDIGYPGACRKKFTTKIIAVILIEGIRQGVKRTAEAK